MSSGLSIHIGLNEVDPGAYAGWSGSLTGAESDAESMTALARAAGYKSMVLLSSAATTAAVLKAISRAAKMLASGDICLITYAGHGGQLPDLDHNEVDGQDETWVLYDRELLDDEIHVALSEFVEGVRVLVVSDSCHSGTVVRDFYRDAMSESRFMQRRFRQAASRSEDPTGGNASARVLIRAVPDEVQQQVIASHHAAYRRIRARTPDSRDVPLEASVLLLAACQDNQSALESGGHGLFTASLLDHWDNGSFAGDYTSLVKAIRADLPPTQSPNLLKEGTPPGFDGERPFTITTVPPMPVVDPPATTNGSGPSPIGTTPAYRFGIFIDAQLADAPIEVQGQIKKLLDGLTQ